MGTKGRTIGTTGLTRGTTVFGAIAGASIGTTRFTTGTTELTIGTTELTIGTKGRMIVEVVRSGTRQSQVPAFQVRPAGQIVNRQPPTKLMELEHKHVDKSMTEPKEQSPVHVRRVSGAAAVKLTAHEHRPAFHTMPIGHVWAKHVSMQAQLP